MLDISDITSYDEIRATLGVDETELPNTVLGLEMYRLNLNAEIQTVDSTLEAKFGVVEDIAEGTRTADQQGLFMAMSLFALYTVALHLTDSLPLFSPKSITDGKAAVGRYADSPYKETILAIKSQASKFKEDLIAALAVYDGTTATVVGLPNYVGTVSPDFDPVVGG